MNRFTTTALAVACLSLLTVSPALAERPSINMLNAKVNQLQAEIDALAGAVLYVFDGDGVSVGRYAGGRPGDVQVIDDANEVIFSINPSGDLTVVGADIFFESTDCSGTPYFSAGQKRMAGFLYRGTASRVFAIETTTPSATESISSWVTGSGNVCTEQPPEDMHMRPGREVFVGLTFPLPVPIYVGLAP